jgi:hypothetical protein
MYKYKSQSIIDNYFINLFYDMIIFYLYNNITKHTKRFRYSTIEILAFLIYIYLSQLFIN